MAEREPTMTYHPGLLDKATISIFHFVNKFVPWYKLPGILGAFNLSALRTELRGYNLHDGYATTSAQGSAATDVAPERFHGARHSDGKYNSLEMPSSGCAGMRFGRNFPRRYCEKPSDDELMNPNPRMISEEVRGRFGKVDGRWADHSSSL